MDTQTQHIKDKIDMLLAIHPHSQLYVEQYRAINTLPLRVLEEWMKLLEGEIAEYQTLMLSHSSSEETLSEMLGAQIQHWSKQRVQAKEVQERDLGSTYASSLLQKI